MAALELCMKEPPECLHPGLNQTIRCGKKWLVARPGDQLLILATGQDNVVRAEARVLGAVETTWEELSSSPASFVLRWNYNDNARYTKGLAEALEKAYGHRWKEVSLVILYFWV